MFFFVCLSKIKTKGYSFQIMSQLSEVTRSKEQARQEAQQQAQDKQLMKESLREARQEVLKLSDLLQVRSPGLMSVF